MAPVVLIAVNAFSSLAAIGAGSWLGQRLLDFPALEVNVPLLAFLFLLALGVDYTTFLVSRVREETPEYGTSATMTRSLVATGGVITSAGVVLAGVFAALVVLPLMLFAQLGFIVGLGVLIDTLVVRTLVLRRLTIRASLKARYVAGAIFRNGTSAVLPLLWHAPQPDTHTSAKRGSRTGHHRNFSVR